MKNRNSVFIAFSVFCTQLTQCSANEHRVNGASKTQSIIGDNQIELLTPSVLENMKVARSVGSLQVVQSSDQEPLQKFAFPECSGLAVTGGFILTAAHCNRSNYVFFTGHRAAEDSRLSFEVVTSGNILRLFFNGHYDARQLQRPEELPILGEALYRNTDLDFAIYAAAQSQTLEVYPLLQTLIQESREAVHLTDALPLAFVVGYPHGLPLARSGNCRVENGDQQLGRLRYDCDTLTGSSGGILIDVATLKPIALHISGALPNDGRFWAENGRFESAEELATRAGCTRNVSSEDENKDDDWQACVAEKASNQGLSLKALEEALKRDNQDLYERMRRF